VVDPPSDVVVVPRIVEVVVVALEVEVTTVVTGVPVLDATPVETVVAPSRTVVIAVVGRLVRLPDTDVAAETGADGAVTNTVTVTITVGTPGGVTMVEPGTCTTMIWGATVLGDVTGTSVGAGRATVVTGTMAAVGMVVLTGAVVDVTSVVGDEPLLRLINEDVIVAAPIISAPIIGPSFVRLHHPLVSDLGGMSVAPDRLGSGCRSPTVLSRASGASPVGTSSEAITAAKCGITARLTFTTTCMSRTQTLGTEAMGRR
jgi:hypothetical protein